MKQISIEEIIQSQSDTALKRMLYDNILKLDPTQDTEINWGTPLENLVVIIEDVISKNDTLDNLYGKQIRKSVGLTCDNGLNLQVTDASVSKIVRMSARQKGESALLAIHYFFEKRV